jgi:ADP-dependent NAD(P)H-hydrate dehydratase / NAD(P)H-hydrate epimerase
MKPLLTGIEIKKWDKFTLEKEPISSIKLMERASETFVFHFTSLFSEKTKVVIFCGSGNNGGDGLAIARILLKMGYQTTPYIVKSENYSPDVKINLKKLKSLTKVIEFDNGNLPSIENDCVIIDGLLGTGLKESPKGVYKSIIDKINTASCTVVSIDIPSGMPCEGVATKNCIKADYTISFQIPKLSFFIAENENYLGHLIVADIGLCSSFLNNKRFNYFLLNNSICKTIKKRQKHSHKGNYGNILISGGSYGKIGAVVLSAKSVLRTGCGLITVHIPECGYEVIQITEPCCMVTVSGKKHIISFPNKKYDAIGIGPGMGKHEGTKTAFLKFIKRNTSPIVIDADGLNILAEENAIDLLKPKTILTPHPKEFDRLFGTHKNSYSRLKKLKSACIKHSLYIVLKGGNTCVGTPDGKLIFNNTGNPGMATGGSGDILTGIITSLLGQGYTQEEACCLGVYIHGKSGDIAEQGLTMQGMYAQDIISCLPDAWGQLLLEKHLQ